MKNFLKSIFTFFFLLCLGFSGCTIDISSDSSDWGTDDYYVYYNYDGASQEAVEKVHELTNAFRTGNESFYRNNDSDNSVTNVNNLGNLVLDADLCRAARIRACEIVVLFDHTRPDGRDCFTVLGEQGISYNTAGENIAARQPLRNESDISVAEKIFYQWKEDNEPYSGQGHRRNMLNSNFTHIGIAGVYAPGSQYGWYWCMILAKK